MHTCHRTAVRVESSDRMGVEAPSGGFLRHGTYTANMSTMSDLPTLSILVVNYNTVDLLRRCLSSIRRHMDGVSYELFVVDNGSSDGSAEAVENEFPEARLFRSGSNLGFAAGNNLALPNARGQYIWLLNSDTELLDGAATELIQFLECSPKDRVGIAGPSLVHSDGEPDACWGKFPTFGRYLTWLVRRIFSGSVVPPHAPQTAPPDGRPFEVEYVNGAALMIRRSVVERIGLMDERFFMFCEDTDWCYRARQAGFRSFILPGVRVQHVRGASLEAWRRRVVEGCSIESHQMFIRKHWNLLAVILYRAAQGIRSSFRSGKNGNTGHS